ncbi:MAG: hypothetical protein COA79_23720 [Planctomycetota bacterium]|nr:MAG: hypothetical protein COA79_23720 [Planctomycetota bacterium]
MFKTVKNLAVLLIASCSLWIIAGCGGESEGNSSSSSSSSTNLDDSTQAVFGESQLSQEFRNSVIQLPDDFTATSTTINQKNNKKSKSNGFDDIALNVYGGIFAYVDFSNEVKENIVKSFVEIYDSKILTIVALDVKHTFNKGEEFFAFKLENPKTEYNWKLSLYDADVDEPVAISLFSKIGNDFKGKIIFRYEDEITIKINQESTILKKSGTIEVIYDSNSDKKTLTIKAVSDLSELVSFAQSNWNSLSKSQQNILDLGQPEKVIINIMFENEEYSVGGTSYHGAGKIKNELEGEGFIFGSNNDTYMFKGKSLHNSDHGVKLAVALPDNQRSDISGVYEDASLSKAFQKGFLDLINENVNRLLDDVDDDDSVKDFEGNVSLEKVLGFQTLVWILNKNIPIDSLEDHGGVVTQEELDAAKEFWPEEKLGDLSFDSLALINIYLTSTSEEITQEAKEAVYYYIMAPKIIEVYTTQNLSISIDDIQTMITKGSEEEVSFGEIFNTLMHIVNPAFFNKADGFLGTYNGEKFFVYDAANNKLTEGNKPEGFEKLNALDLDTIEDVSPKTVFDLVLTVQ